VLDILRTLNTAHGLTVVLVTHSPAAAAYAQRLVRMRDGRIEDEGTRKNDAGDGHADEPNGDSCAPASQVGVQSPGVHSGNGQLRQH
jgi:ABC-type phosphate/phosphonate transport system ATPase subunit